MAIQKDFVYLLDIKNGPNTMFMGVFKTKESAIFYAKRNKENEDGIYFYHHKGLAMLEEVIQPCDELGENWVISQTVLQA